MKQENEREELLRKFIADQCSPGEIRQVLQYLGSGDIDPVLHRLIAQELQAESLSAEKMDPRLTGEMHHKILDRLRRSGRLTGRGNGGGSARAPRKEATEASEAILRPAIVRKRYPLATWKMAAAVAAIFVLAGTAYYRFFIYTPWIVQETGYGEISTFLLPDSSEVVLNSNSSIRYARDWAGRPEREVWIEGEAFFSVRHTAHDDKFIVHPSDNFDVEVLGTEFAVYDRPDASRVVLNSGNVQLNIHNENVQDHVQMLPGDLVEIEKQSGKYERQQVDPERYTSWINGEIILDNTSFGEISDLLRETYGLVVQVPDSTLYGERFTGTVPSNNIESLLKALGLAFGLDTKTTGKTVIFKTRNY